MEHWLITSKHDTFRLDDYLLQFNCVDWKQGNSKFQIGDIIYIYCSLPKAKIQYMMEVIAINIPYEKSFSDEEYWGNKHEYEEGIEKNRYCRFKLIASTNTEKLSLTQLKQYGIKYRIQGRQKITGKLLSYIQSCFGETNNFEAIELPNETTIYEGAKKTIVVNQYERNPMARQKCIEVNGCRCKVCGMDFEETYGEIGRGFIHVHHIVPISTIGETYQIDPVNDLIPVCPNCHAMLHHGHDGKVFTIDELKTIIQK